MIILSGNLPMRRLGGLDCAEGTCKDAILGLGYWLNGTCLSVTGFTGESCNVPVGLHECEIIEVL